MVEISTEVSALRPGLALKMGLMHCSFFTQYVNDFNFVPGYQFPIDKSFWWIIKIDFKHEKLPFCPIGLLKIGTSWKFHHDACILLFIHADYFWFSFVFLFLIQKSLDKYNKLVKMNFFFKKYSKKIICISLLQTSNLEPFISSIS